MALRIENFSILVLAFVPLVWGQNAVPRVSIYDIGIDYVVFDVQGPNKLHNLPVVSVGVNYTQVNSTETHWAPKNHPWKQPFSSLHFERLFNLTKLDAGSTYLVQFYVINTEHEHGPPSTPTRVLLPPQTPDFSITHSNDNTIRLFWGYPPEKQVDYFLLTVDKESSIGCGFTMNFTKCYGTTYDLTNIESGQTYVFTFASHNPSGFSDSVIVRFPVE